MSHLELALALDFTVRIAAVGLALTGFELLSLGAQWQPAGVFSPGAVAPFRLHPGLLQRSDRWLRPALLIQTGGALALLALGIYPVAGRLALLLSLGAALAVRWRRNLGGDGAEQMGAVILAAACLAALPLPSQERIRWVVIFLTAQLCLSYTTAGIAKLISPLWRGGQALPAILSTSGHGHPAAAAFFRRYPAVSLAASWGVILFESLFPLAFLGPFWLIAAALILGLCFHLACAALMGLNSFVWSFPAVYPCALALWWAFLR